MPYPRRPRWRAALSRERTDEGSPAVIRRGSPKRGELVKREQFAPLANENAGSLAQMGYFTTLKISGKSVDFGSVTDYWMEERPDHLVEVHRRDPG